MKRIGITQRVELAADITERRDCLDQRFGPLLQQLSLVPVPLLNSVREVPAYVEALGLDGVILSGGNDVGAFPGAESVSAERDRFETELIQLCREQRLPLLGICRGLQLLCQLHGAEAFRVPGHVATRHIVIPQGEGRGLWPDPMRVNSFHGYGVGKLPQDCPLQVWASDEEGGIEAVANPSALQFAVMWHPEREPALSHADHRLFGRVFSI